MDYYADNRFGMVGRKFINALSIIANNSDKDKRVLFDTLSQLRLPKNKCLGLHLPSYIGHGDNSWFYIYPKGNDPLDGLSPIENKFASLFNKVNNNDFEYLQVIPSAMGAWQAYLYSISSTILPCYWHGGYEHRTYIFSQKDLDNCDGYRQCLNSGEVTDGIMEEQILPDVTYKRRKAKVTCCFWSQWMGLVQDNIIICFDSKQDKIASMSINSRTVLVKYNCGILF